MMGHCESMKVVSNNDNQLTMHHQLEIVNQVKMKRANFTSINKVEIASSNVHKINWKTTQLIICKNSVSTD